MSPVNDRPGGTSGLPGLAVRAAGLDEISRRLAASGQDFNNSVYPLLSRIVQLEAEQPWGDDDIGHEFLTTVYHSSVDGTPYNQLLHTVLDEAGNELVDFGTAGKQTAQRFTEVDAAAFRRTTRRAG